MRFTGIGEWLRVALQGRSFACLLCLVSLSILLSARPASAGVWRFHVSNTSYSHTINGSNWGNAWTSPADANNSIGLNPISVGGSGMVNQSVTAAATLSATITATWVPDPSLASDPAPSPISMKITSSTSSDGVYGGTLYYGNSANDGFSDPVNSTGVSQGIHLIPVTGSTFTISVSLSASYTSPASSSGISTATAVINGLSIAPDTRTVAISSYLGQTTYKGPPYTQPVQSDVYQHILGLSDNSADSMVFQVNDPVAGQQFVTSGNFTANASNFTQPKYTWTITGDGNPDPSITVPYLAPGGSNFYGVATLPVSLNFGGPNWDLTKTKTTQISVKVVDTDGAQGADTYSVTWHAPQEDFINIGVTKNVPQLYGALTDIVKNATQPATLTVPGQGGEIDWGDIEQKAGLPVAVAGAGAGGLLLVPEIAAGPYGWAVIVFQGVAAAAGYVLSIQSPTHPGDITVSGTADYNEYLADVKTQVEKNAANDITNPRFIPATLAETAKDFADNLNDTSQWMNDPFFMGSAVKWQAGWLQDLTSETCDEYDTSGYRGELFKSVWVDTTPFRYFVWTCAYNPPPPPPGE